MAAAHTAFFDALKAAGPGREDSLRRMDVVAHVLDTAFAIPGTKQRVGIDAIIGLVPGIGDLVTTVLSSYVIWEARQLGLPRHVIARMLVNLGIHGVVGSIPIAGDVFAALFRVNRRNMRIVRAHLDRYRAPGAVGGSAIIDAEYRVVARPR